MAKVLIINGPNLNLLGKREPTLYGSETFEDVLKGLRAKFPELEISYFQSQSESELIDALHRAQTESVEGILLNPGAFTHTSLALADAIRAISTPVIEVHISNVAGREWIRQKSLISAHAAGVVQGFGVKSYELALSYFL